MAGKSAVVLAGFVKIQDAMLTLCAGIAAADYKGAEQDEFSGDAVRDLDMSGLDWKAEECFPVDDLAEAGLRLKPGRGVKMYATCGVEPHVDEMDGLSVAVVVHSDGFRFKQGRRVVPLVSGTWFVFDDRLSHEVVESRKSTSLVVLTAALEVC